MNCRDSNPQNDSLIKNKKQQIAEEPPPRIGGNDIIRLDLSKFFEQESGLENSKEDRQSPFSRKEPLGSPPAQLPIKGEPG